MLNGFVAAREGRARLRLQRHTNDDVLVLVGYLQYVELEDRKSPLGFSD